MAACSTGAITYPTVFGAEFLSMEVNLVTNYSQYVHKGYYVNHGAVNVTNINFCNVTLEYTHPGQNENIKVQVWLPIENWNARLQAIGGGGWQAGLYAPSLMGMTAAIGEGYSAISTDAGLGSAVFPYEWALLSPGNVNLYLLQDLASVSLNDMAIIGKTISAEFYGSFPEYSYFSGCSQGGRQGLMLAQRYPNAFDGIAASAPAINWNNFVFSTLWPSFVMRSLKEYPPACEFDAITEAVIEACDSLDGVADGIIADIDECCFNPTSMVGKTINCSTFDNAPWSISSAAASVIRAAWSGPKKFDNSDIWFGVGKDTSTTTSSIQQGIISTICDLNRTCNGGSFELAEAWIKLFILKNASSDLSNMNHGDFDRAAQLSTQMYDSIIGTNDPDLSAFRNRGGKLISYHGTADGIIPIKGSLHYYDSVTALDPNVHDFFRLFTSPGLGHCFGGNGAYPDGTFDAMRKWVEDGIAPEILNATTVGTVPILVRPLCPYPMKQNYDGVGNHSLGLGFSCK
ncbi:hypothetical protein TWF481_006474 [Arthrobotrys musiformis]|uniref:Carboxylic ester hydrolase n=1 Tax=Arthrobotrys musiformis TaxID=47236 RepID=A0AAV9W8M1_9PEZI